MTVATDSVPTVAAPTTMNPRDMRIIWLLLGAVFVVILNETIMNVAITHLMTDLDITALAAQWLTTVFLLTMAVVIPITGFLLKRFTTRQAFIGGMSLFTLGTFAAAIAPGFEVLLAARIVQASGTAIMMPLLMTTLMTLVPAQGRGRLMGRVSVVMSVAPAIGPALSGVILATLNWRWMFGVVLPIALVMLFVGAKWITNVGETTRAPIDLLSVALSALGFGGIVYGLSQIGGATAEGTTRAADAAAQTATVSLTIAFGVGIVSMGLFLWRQVLLQRNDDALLDLRVFRSANFSLAMSQMFVVALTYFGALLVLPLYLQHVLELTAFDTGLVMIPGALVMGLSGPIIGRIYDRWGTRPLMIPGTIIASAVFWFYSTVGQSTPVFVIVVAQLVLSLGLALSFTPLFTASLASLAPRFYSYGSAVVGTVHQVAGAAGIAVFVTVMSAIQASAQADGVSEIAAEAAGIRGAYMLGATISLLAIVGAFLVRKPADEPIAAELTH